MAGPTHLRSSGATVGRQAGQECDQLRLSAKRTKKKALIDSFIAASFLKALFGFRAPDAGLSWNSLIEVTNIDNKRASPYTSSEPKWSRTDV